MQKLTDREKAKQLHIESKGKLPLTEIAEQLGRPASTVRSWKSKDNWDNAGTTLHNKSQRSKKTQQTKKNSKSKAKKKENESEPDVSLSEELTDQQQLFCVYYLKYFNATKAYQKAYECNYNSASVEGFKHLRKPKIKMEIERLKKERFEDIQLDSKAIMQKYVDIAFADITDYIEFGEVERLKFDDYGNQLKDDDGNPITYIENYVKLKDSNNLDGTIISEISEGANGIKIKLHDKMKALEWLAKNVVDFKDSLDLELLSTRIEKEKTLINKIKAEIGSIATPTEEVEEVVALTPKEEQKLEELYKVMFSNTNDRQDGDS